MTKITKKQALIDALQKLGEGAAPDLIKQTVNSFYPDESVTVSKTWTSPVGRAVFTISIFLGFLSLFLIWKYHDCKELMLTIYGAWTIGPPVWFLYEYVWLFPERLRHDSVEFGDLKYVHELSGKIWAGLVVVMTAILIVSYKFSFTAVK